MSENGQKRSRQETKSLLRRFTAYYKPHKTLFAKDMAASVTVAIIGVIYPIITRTMLNDLIPDRNYTMIIVLGGTLLCLAGGVKVSGVVGVGTVITAFFMGPLIDFFNRKLARPFLYGPQQGPAAGRE